MYHVLTLGGRIGISDMVAADHLTPEQRATRGSFVSCVAGALSQSQYLGGLSAVGFQDSSIQFTHQVAEGIHTAIIRATKPSA